MFLMQLWKENCLKEPAFAMDLLNMSHFLECCDSLLHDRYLFWSIVYLLNGDRHGVASINGAFVIVYRYEDAALIEDGPVFHKEGINLIP